MNARSKIDRGRKRTSSREPQDIYNCIEVLAKLGEVLVARELFAGFRGPELLHIAAGDLHEFPGSIVPHHVLLVRAGS